MSTGFTGGNELGPLGLTIYGEDRFSAVLDRLDNRMTAIQGTLGGIGKAAAIFGATAGAVKVVRRAWNALHQTYLQTETRLASLNRKAKEFETSQKFLATLNEGTQKFGLAAGQTDRALTIMIRNIGRARDGSKQMTDTFERFGLSVEKLSRLDTEGQFRAIAEAIRKLPTQQERTQAVSAMLGGGRFGAMGAAGLARLLAEGEAGFKKLGESANKYKGIMTEAEAATIAAAKASSGELNSAWEGLYKQLSVELAPAFTAVRESIASIIESASKIEVLSTIFGAVGGAIQAAVLPLQLFSDLLKGLRGGDIQEVTEENVQAMANSLPQAAQAMLNSIKDPQQAADIIGSLRKQAKGFTEQEIAEYNTLIDRTRANQLMGGKNNLTDYQTAGTVRIEEFMKQMGLAGHNFNQDIIEKVFGVGLENALKMGREKNKVTEEMRQGLDSAQLEEKTRKQKEREMKLLEEQIKQADRLMDKWKNQIELAKNVESAFENIAEGQERLTEIGEQKKQLDEDEAIRLRERGEFTALQRGTVEAFKAERAGGVDTGKVDRAAISAERQREQQKKEAEKATKELEKLNKEGMKEAHRLLAQVVANTTPGTQLPFSLLDLQ